MLRKITITILLLAIILLAFGCGGLARTKILKHPETPMLIIESRGRVKVAVEVEGELVEYGWVKVPEGWTLVLYDWEE